MLLTSTKNSFIAILCLLSLSFVSCQKEVSLEGPVGGDTLIINDGGTSSGTAVFSLTGAPNTCISPVVGGTYQVGTALNNTNAVSLKVNVSSTGTYSISTADINGVRFSKTDSFTVTGPQTIMLTGSGTPATPGTFNYKPGSAWCAFPVTFNSVASGPIAAGVMDCSLIWSAGTFPPGVELTDSTKIFIPVSVTSAGAYSICSAPMNGVVFSASGMLQTGNQTITLTGEGIPEQAGVFPLSISFGPSSCSVNITFQ